MTNHVCTILTYIILDTCLFAQMYWLVFSISFVLPRRLHYWSPEEGQEIPESGVFTRPRYRKIDHNIGKQMGRVAFPHLTHFPVLGPRSTLFSRIRTDIICLQVRSGLPGQTIGHVRSRVPIATVRGGLGLIA